MSKVPRRVTERRSRLKPSTASERGEQDQERASSEKVRFFLFEVGNAVWGAAKLDDRILNIGLEFQASNFRQNLPATPQVQLHGCYLR